MNYIADFQARTDLTERYGNNALLLYALQLRFEITDIISVASDALTDGGDDKKCDLIYIDPDTGVALELAPEGTGYRARTRFSKFFNLPELMNLFKEVADIKTADQLNLPTPEVEYHNIVAQPTEHQQEMVKALSERASEVHRGSVDPSVDNMLKIVRC